MKWTKNLSIICFFLLLFLLSSCEDTLKYVNFEQFDNTKAEKLADAVRNEDIDEIERIVKIDKVPVDFQEPEIGNTVLMVAVVAQKRESIKKLLELGANPNLTNKKWCESTFHLACERFLDGKCDIKLIDLLIKYGADVNFPQTYNHSNGTYFQTPLMLSVNYYVWNPDDRLFYHLIKKGADINTVGVDESTSPSAEPEKAIVIAPPVIAVPAIFGVRIVFAPVIAPLITE
jgi:ankyrin repeat protein